MSRYFPKLIPHPAAALFPMLPDDQLNELGHDIAKNGLQQSIITWKGQIVDGRNRFEACKRMNLQCQLEEAEFRSEEEVVAYIISTNLRRRHLTPSAVAKIGAELANLGRGGDRKSDDFKGPHGPLISDNKAVTVAQSAAMTGASERTIKRAAAVKKNAPDLFKRIDKDLSVNKAYKLMRERMPKKSGKVKVKPAPTDPPPSAQPDPDFDGWFNSPEGKRMELIARGIREMLRNNGVKLWRHPDNDIGVVVGVDEPSDDNFKWIGV